MMTNILYDDWLFLELKGQVGSYGKDEIARNYKHLIKSVAVACLDVRVKHVTIDLAKQAKQDMSFPALFEKDDLIHQENLSVNTVQLAAIAKSKVADIYQYFKPVKVTFLVPYQVAVRAYLKSKGFLNDQKAIILVDNLGVKAVITVFQGLRFSESRQIAVRDLQYMADEIKRSWQIFNSAERVDRQYLLLSNNRDWLNEFVHLKLADHQEVKLIDALYPVLDGLGGGKFINSYILPEDLARQKKHALMRQQLFNSLILMGGLILSALIYLIFLYQEHDAKMKLAQSNAVLKELNNDLSSAYQLKLLDYLRISHQSTDALVADFFDHMPYGYWVKEFNIETAKLGQRKFGALIYPRKSNYYGVFLREGIWRSARISDDADGDQMGARVELEELSYER